MKTCTESGIKNHAASLTTVAGAAFKIGRDLLKVAALNLEHFKAFRAAARAQLLRGNRQVAVPAAQTRPCRRHQRQYFMVADRHGVRFYRE